MIRIGNNNHFSTHQCCHLDRRLLVRFQVNKALLCHIVNGWQLQCVGVLSEVLTTNVDEVLMVCVIAVHGHSVI